MSSTVSNELERLLNASVSVQRALGQAGGRRRKSKSKSKGRKVQEGGRRRKSKSKTASKGRKLQEGGRKRKSKSKSKSKGRKLQEGGRKRKSKSDANFKKVVASANPNRRLQARDVKDVSKFFYHKLI